MNEEKEQFVRIILERHPDVLGLHACQVKVEIKGDRRILGGMLASCLQSHPGLLALVCEALMNLDNVKTISATPNN